MTFPVQNKSLSDIPKSGKQRRWYNQNDSRVTKVPRRADPLVITLYEIMIMERASYQAVAEASGVSAATLRNDWKKGHSPSLRNFRAVAEALGFTLVLKYNRKSKL